MADETLVKLSAVRFGYPRGDVFLGPCDLTIHPGTVHALLGPNGAGKSTLLRLVSGIATPHSGSVTWLNENLQTLSPRERAKRIAFLPQHTETPDDLSARDVVMLGRFPVRENRFFDSVEDDRVVDACMATTEVTAFATRRLSEMSGGESQRVHIAAALAQKPQMLILDEPTSSLDPYHQLEIARLLRGLTHEQHLTVLLATHDLNLASQFADVATLMRDGSIVATGHPRDTLTPKQLQTVYGVAFDSVRRSHDERPWVFATTEPAAT